MSELLENLDKLHTTELGVVRIKRNLGLDERTDAVVHCKEVISDASTAIVRKGKNFYATGGDAVITVNASKWSIITAHKIKRN